MKHFQIYLFFLISICVGSCTNKKEVDVSQIKLTISIERFDQKFAQAGADLQAQQDLRKKYTWFYDDYVGSMLSLGSIDQPGFLQNLNTVLNNPDYAVLKTTVDKTFPDLKTQEAELEDAFKRVKYYYPEQKLPRLISFLSGFAVQTPVGNDYIGIGLDMFLGSKGDQFYPALRQSIPYYIARRFKPEYISLRVVEVLLRENMFPENDGDKSLLSKMIYNGKIMYSLDHLLPTKQDSLKIGYTADQLAWCEENEGGIWAYLLQNELLYNTDYMQIQKYLAEAPFTPGLGENSNSAPKLGIWVGWQIVQEYMEEHPDKTLQQLMEEKDAQRILRESKYKPKY